MAEKRYQQIYLELKSRIQDGTYQVGSYLPSEHDLCKTYSITRTTARRALDELLREGFIEKYHGKGSQVKERRQTLGLLTVKGFSEAVGENVHTSMLQNPQFVEWPADLPFPASELELNRKCIFFERLRGVGDTPVMLEQNWFAALGLDDFTGMEFVGGSFFKTLSNKYFIEIVGSEQEIRAESASSNIAELLKLRSNSPILKISVKFSTSRNDLNIYSYLYCNTEKYPIGNMYKH